jgi:hypothetical protein
VCVCVCVTTGVGVSPRRNYCRESIVEGALSSSRCCCCCCCCLARSIPLLTRVSRVADGSGAGVPILAAVLTPRRHEVQRLRCSTPPNCPHRVFPIGARQWLKA